MNNQAALDKLNAAAADARKVKNSRLYNALTAAASTIAQYMYYENSGADMSEARFPTAADVFKSELNPDNEPSADQVAALTMALEALNA